MGSICMRVLGLEAILPKIAELLQKSDTKIWVVGVFNNDIKEQIHKIFNKRWIFHPFSKECRMGCRSQSVPSQANIDTFVTRIFAVRWIDLFQCTTALGHRVKRRFIAWVFIQTWSRNQPLSNDVIVSHSSFRFGVSPC